LVLVCGVCDLLESGKKKNLLKEDLKWQGIFILSCRSPLCVGVEAIVKTKDGLNNSKVVVKLFNFLKMTQKKPPDCSFNL